MPTWLWNAFAVIGLGWTAVLGLALLVVIVFRPSEEEREAKARAMDALEERLRARDQDAIDELLGEVGGR